MYCVAEKFFLYRGSLDWLNAWVWGQWVCKSYKFKLHNRLAKKKKYNLEHQSRSTHTSVRAFEHSRPIHTHTPTQPPTSNQPKPQALFWLLIEFSQSAAIAQVMWVIDYKNLSHGHRFHTGETAQSRARESWCELNAALRISANSLREGEGQGAAVQLRH